MGATWAEGNIAAVLPAETAGLLSPRNAARWLDVSRSRIYLLMADGTIPYIRIGNQRRIRVTDLEGYVARLAADTACHQPQTSLKDYPPRLRDLSRGVRP